MKSILLDRNWQQLTDGTNHINLQVVSGSVLYTESDNLPDEDTPGFSLNLDGKIWNIGPEKSWCRARDSSPAIVVISEARV
ncbi:hypothetical protein A4F97_18425 [Salmonella enterica]|nr:hypothetical protein [Salmonella enterica]ECO1013946.1 hypothetical protein [Salmonella enterica subsp. enterica serovar Newport]EDY2177150.1 hypothetical protein [Salmonella enterica subsp. enterica serovar SI Rough:r:1,5]EGK2057751.1 hypothetical protein [Salmonella enterica subsp. enterica serovar Infantis]EAX4719069.1 hypothetical protein [Salmonella enterica]